MSDRFYRLRDVKMATASDPINVCVNHEFNTIDKYCGDCDVVGCTSCMTSEHSDCKDIQPIHDVIDTHFKESLVEETNKKLLEMKSEVEKLQSVKETSLEVLNKTRKTVVNEIKEFRKELEVLEKLEEESIRELETCFNRLHSILQNEMEKAENELQIMEKTELDLMKSENKRADRFVSVKVSQKKIAKTERILLELQRYADDRISFAPFSHLKHYLQQFESLGLFRFECSSVLRQKSSAYVIKTERDLNVKTHGDSKTCRLYGSCLIGDSELLLTDFMNKQLKRVDIIQMKVVDQCNLPCSPYSVCQTQRKEAVVTLNDNSIQFISLDGQMNPTRNIRLNHLCYGIAYKDDRLYITAFSIFIYIYNIAGELLEKLSTHEYGNTSDIRHVLFSDTGNTMFVTHFSKGVIASYDHMKHSYSFSDSELSAAKAICSDGRGNILVSGSESQNVIQIGQDWKKKGVVVKSSVGFSGPESMCFDRKRCTLIVTQENSDIVKFFDLE